MTVSRTLLFHGTRFPYPVLAARVLWPSPLDRRNKADGLTAVISHTYVFRGATRSLNIGHRFQEQEAILSRLKMKAVVRSSFLTANDLQLR
jgi:hypothetical protein